MKIEEIIYNILKEQFCISDVINPETNLIDEFEFESISLVELASILSRETGIKIDQAQAIQWTTVNSILNTFYAYEKVGANK
ncbi:hypothetical protein C4L39_16415 [Clostridium diolis]|uniref:acyl carrier protein n=1 Tax=Clostridium diolis TaxID=223919 RepID=UPI000D11C5E7|nr:acyl carrier protein [Clostridium diolis]PSM56699.1 hypothetical protein C4L39_16415 [Clostridium diolis]